MLDVQYVVANYMFLLFNFSYEFAFSSSFLFVCLFCCQDG